MKKIYVLLACTLYSLLLTAQNVGIGINTPATELHIHSSGVFTGALFTTDGTGSSFGDGLLIGMQYQNGLPSNQYGLLQTRDNYPLILGANNSTSQIRLLTSGNVTFSDSIGIGTGVPLQRIDAIGNILLRGNGVTQKRLLFRSDDGTETVASIGHFSDEVLSMAFHNASQFSRFYFNVATSKMGIGLNPLAEDGHITVNVNSSTSTPHIKLRELVSGDYARLEFATAGAERVWHIAGQTVAGAGTTNRGDDLLNIWNSSRGDIMSFRGDGRVGILTAQPATGYALSVRGRIMCEELRVQLFSAWPDYVFADNYTLKPAKQIEQFIKENKHLPGIPSAAEVERDGIQVGDMQKRMMEKIEELTLYIIDLYKEMDTLKAQIKN